LIWLLAAAIMLPAADIYGGKVYGLFQPLSVQDNARSIIVKGETFEYIINKGSGQIVSAKALGDEFVAEGTAFPNPYIGLMPENDPGARRTGGPDRPRFGYEKAVEMRPLLWSGGLTDAYRFDAAGSKGIVTRIVRADAESVAVQSRGTYTWPDGRATPLGWEITYLLDVDGFTKVTVRLTTTDKVKLRWNCFNHAFLAKASAEFLSRAADPQRPPFNVMPEPTVSIRNAKADEPVLESHWNPFFQLSSRATGIEFSKEDFDDRWSGYRDSSVVLEDGRVIDTGAVQTKDGETLRGHDSRGKVGVFTQLYVRDRALELEEFDIRNATYPLNPGEERRRTFWVQMTPARHPRNDLNSIRDAKVGPNQIQMVRWRGRKTPWEPPSDEQVRLWAQMGVNLIVGGANYFSAEYTPTDTDKVRHFLETAHRFGIKVIPYVTFSDFNFEAPGYQEHAAEWMTSKGIEYANETTLMCFGAEGWRQFLEKQWDALLRDFEFDGLYIDCWFHTRMCSNARHGCGSYLARYVTDGFHDFAKRARRAVARHTDGKGVLMLNANMLLFSGVVPWFDIRLNGENNDPRSLPVESVVTTWNGRSQGLTSLAIWRPNQDSRDMMDFCSTFTFPFRLRVLPESLEDWVKPARPEYETARFYWDVWRFFDVNNSERYSNYDTRGVLEMARPGSVVTAFTRDGRVLFVAGFVKTSSDEKLEPERSEELRILAPETLGLKPEARYRVVNLRNRRYLVTGAVRGRELSKLPIKLRKEPAIFLLEPESARPRVVYFGGADGATVEQTRDALKVRLRAAEGSPVTVWLDSGGAAYRPATPGILQEDVPGDFSVFTGRAPGDGVIVFERQ
jgi:uncharacterized protein DUF6259